MAKITTYDVLVGYAQGLQAGDNLVIGPDDVSPEMTQELEALSLATTLTVVTSTVATDPPNVEVTGSADVFGLDGLLTKFTFTPVDTSAANGPFLLAIETQPAQGTKWELLPAFVLSDPAIYFGPEADIQVYQASIGCDIAIGTDQALTLPIKMSVPTYPELDWILIGDFTNQPLSANAFAALSDGLVLSDYLPSPLDALADFGLTGLSIAFNPKTPRISNVLLDIAYTKSWSALNIIDVPAGGVTFEFFIDFLDSAKSYAELDAQFEIATVPVDIGAHFAPENFYVWGKLQDGRTVNIAAVFAHYQVTLPDGFPDIEINKLGMTANISLGSYTFDLIAQIDAGSALKIKDLTVAVAVATEPNTTVKADFSATMVIAAETTLFLGATYDGDGTGLTLVGNATEIPMGKLIAYLLSEFGISADQIPEPVRTLDLTSLDTSYNTKTGDFHFKCVGKFTIYEEPVVVTFTIDILHPNSPARASLPSDAVTGSMGYSATFGGTIDFAGHEFGVRFNTDDTKQMIFVAYYLHKAADGDVKLRDLVASISQPLAANIPGDIAINLEVVKFGYLRAPGEGVQDPVNHFLFGIQLGAEIGLTDIPLIGDKLPSDLTAKFERLQFAYAEPDFTDAQAAAINALLPPEVEPLPAAGLKQGVLISSSLKLGDYSKDIALPIPTGGQQLLAPPGDVAMPAPLAGAASPSVGMSINVQKTLGPVSIRKLGLAYENNTLFATGDISLNAGILAIGLLDLGIGSRLDKFAPAVKLAGLTITVEEGPIGVSGGLYGSIDPLNFNGALQVTMPSMTIGALGGYAQLGNDPSFFMYLSVNRPLFGYPFFFVDGIAGGLGFNRDLMIPDIDGVAQFPLVAWATGSNPPGANPNGDIGSQVQSVIKALASEIPPKVGEYWIAAGIKFSSFKVLDSFALVTVAFGTQFKFALLGLTTASLPPDVGSGIEPIGYVEMALRVSYAPDAGLLQVEAKLTPASYILSKSCNLTGGFAYYMWFKDNPGGDPSGYHAGDFVVTLGGYNSAYTAPTYFPKVPRLGFNWRIDDHTTIKGGIYFAITPGALMAGGALEAVWQSGDLKAWFTAHADFLLSWKPFYYQASIGLSIGASYKLDLWFTSATISVHLGVELSLWGPPFGGSIYVDLTVISFTVGIGNQSRPAPKPISWPDFKQSFLPKSDAAHAQPLAIGATVETDSYCMASVIRGLVKDLSTVNANPDEPDWIVNAELLELTSMTALPIKSATLITGGGVTESLPAGNDGFGVAPVNIAANDFVSTHAISVNKLLHGAPDPTFNVNDHMTVERATSNLPIATWGDKMVVSPSISQVNKSPATVSDLAVGYRITSRQLPPEHTPLPIAIAILQFESGDSVDFTWLTPDVPTTDDFDQSKAMAEFQATLTASAGKRSATIAALNAPGLNLGIDPDVDVSALANSADKILLHAPILSLLGEERQS